MPCSRANILSFGVKGRMASDPNHGAGPCYKYTLNMGWSKLKETEGCGPVGGSQYLTDAQWVLQNQWVRHE